MNLIHIFCLCFLPLTTSSGFDEEHETLVRKMEEAFADKDRKKIDLYFDEGHLEKRMFGKDAKDKNVKINIGQMLLSQIRNRGMCKFVKMHNNSDGDPVALFRLTNPLGGDYYEFLFARKEKTDRLVFADIYIYGSLSWFSDILMMQQKRMKIQKSEEADVRLGQDAKMLNTLDEIGSNFSKQMYAENEELFNEMTPGYQKKSDVMIKRLQNASFLDKNRFEPILRRFDRLFGDHPATHLNALVPLQRQQRFDEVLERIDRMEKVIGKDAWLETKKADCYYYQRNFEEAKKYARNAIKMESDLTNGYLAYLRISIAEKDFEEATRTVEYLVDDLKFSFPELTKDELFRPLILSQPFLDWVNARKAKLEAQGKLDDGSGDCP